MKIAFVVILVFVIAALSQARRTKLKHGCVMRRYRGCTLKGRGKCVCSRLRACKNPFTYRRKLECKNSAKRSCSSRPCRNGGLCMDMPVGYKCECSGTGYYGTNCQRECPIPDRRDTLFWKFPPACVSI